MNCPLNAEGIHRIEHGDTCACGWQFRVPPICVSITVMDRDTVLIDEGFNTDHRSAAIAALRRAADTLERS